MQFSCVCQKKVVILQAFSIVGYSVPGRISNSMDMKVIVRRRWTFGFRLSINC